MRNAPPSSHQSAPASNGYCPSVPISVYRELTAELQAAQALLDSLNAQNQQLIQQNQQLRQEVQNIAQSAARAQQLTGVFQPALATEVAPSFSPEPASAPPANPRRQKPAPEVISAYPSLETTNPVFSENLLAEVEVRRDRRPTSPSSAREVNGKWLALAIFMIVLTAFGTGFLIVRPILKR
jgi:hypothetical protein